MTSRGSRSAHPAGPVVLVVLLLALVSACGGSGSSGEDGRSAAQEIAAARKALAATKGVTLLLKTDKLPQGSNGILSAQGVGTDAPAFQGTVSAVLNGLSGELPIVSVDGKVYVRLFGAPYKQVDPGDFGAPDPAEFFGPEGTLPGLLRNVTSAKKGDDVREGRDVLSTVTGKIPGSAVQKIFSSASTDDFDATFALDDRDRLVQARVTGPFFGGSDRLTYTIAFSKYGESPTITAP